MTVTRLHGMAIVLVVGAGSAWAQLPPISHAAGIVHASDDGMRCDGVTDDHAALMAALSRAADQAVAGAMAVDLPLGRCMLSAPATLTLAGNQTLTLRGRGAYATELVFTGDGDGIVAAYASAAAYTRDAATGAALHLADLSVVHGPATTGRDGVRVNGDSANAAGIIEPDTLIENVVVRGGSNGGGWANGIVLQDTANTELRHVSAMCANADSPLAASGVGVALRTTGARYATRHNLTNYTEWGCNKGLEIGQRIQGVSVVGGNFTAGNIGIDWDAVGRQELLAVINSQFSTFVAGIHATNLQNIQLSNNTFYDQNAYATTAGSWIAIDLAEVDNSEIIGNGVIGVNAGNEVGIRIVNDIAMVASNRPTTIGGNTFFNLAGPVLYAANDTGNVLFTGNATGSIAADPPVALAPGTSVAFAGNRWAGVLYAVGYPGSPGFTLSVPAGILVGKNWPTRPEGLPPGAVWRDGSGLLHATP